MTEESPSPQSDPQSSSPEKSIVAFHLRFGWWSLLLYICLGTTLELLHGFKIGWYLNVDNETRRLMWTLAHAHGTLLSLVNIAFAATVFLVPCWSASSRVIASRAICGATILMPLGFLLGGLQIYAGDPGIGIALVPAGAFCLLTGVLLTASGTGKARV